MTHLTQIDAPSPSHSTPRLFDVDWIAPPDRTELTISLTLLLLMLHAGGRWYLGVPVLTLCVAAFAFPRLRTNDNLWFALTLVLATANSFHWYTIDNHKYLITWWALAVSMALATPRPAEALAWSARVMLGLCFAFATGWKAVSADFTSGDFFEFHLLFDQRFAELAWWVAGVTPDIARQNHEALVSLTSPEAQRLSVSLTGTPALRALSGLMTGWTLFIEGALALAFLLPTRTALSRWRDLALLVFVLSTYLLAPVMGFALVLLCMGAAQARTGWARIGYALCFAFVQLYQSPWKNLVNRFILGDS